MTEAIQFNKHLFEVLLFAKQYIGSVGGTLINGCKTIPSLCSFTQVVVEHVTNISEPVIKTSMDIQSVVGIEKGKMISGFGVWEKLFRGSRV